MKKIYSGMLFVFLQLAVPAVNALDIGASAPVFTLPMLDNKEKNVSLSSFRGEVIYLDFWASWCAPCRTSFPLLNAFLQKKQAEGFRIIAVNVDENEAAAKKFLQDYPVDFTVLQDSGWHWVETYDVDSMPTSFLIDRKGVIRYRHSGFTSADMAKIENKINALLAEEVP